MGCPRIAIVGAGPAGLTLARLLTVAKVEVDVVMFEKDASPTARLFQGGSLDLHPETGLAAIKAMDLWDEFTKWARYEGEEMVIADKNGTQLVHLTDAADYGPGARPEIDREKLKDLLLDSVAQDSVKWDKHLKSIDADRGLLCFGDGSTEGPFDLVVGCEGAWSKVRRVLTDVKPSYAGIVGWELHIDNPTNDYPEISSMVGRGSYFAFSDGKFLSAQRMGNDSIKLGVWLQQQEGYTTKILGEHVSDPIKLNEIIMSHVDDWIPEIKSWIRVGTKHRPWNLYELPVGLTFKHRKGYTIISDAAHLMTPFAGEGVNAGMRDALELSKAIVTSVKGSGDLDEAVQAFEEEMFPRNEAVQQQTMRNKIYGFKDDAPVGYMTAMMDVLTAMAGFETRKGIWWYPMQPFKALVYSYFWTVTKLGLLKRRWKTRS